MLDTRGSGQEYSRMELSKLEKISDLYTNDKRCIYAELLRGCDGGIVCFREWLTNHGGGDSYNFCVINSMVELKEELKKDVDHGDLAAGMVDKICKEIAAKGIF